jgi:hypothetical protein
MTTSVYSFRDGVGRFYHVRLYRVAPAAFGGGGSPPFTFSTITGWHHIVKPQVSRYQ